MATDAEPPNMPVFTTSQPCQVHELHKPHSHVNHRHHVWPQGEGGPNIADNIIAVCPTGHYNIHHLISEYKLHLGTVPYKVLKQYSLGERKYAELGYQRITRGAM